jgi:hypothetical protein
MRALILVLCCGSQEINYGSGVPINKALSKHDENLD